ncbi:hypothetical protein PRIPAC_78264, partial [Pristionchus pacificus]
FQIQFVVLFGYIFLLAMQSFLDLSKIGEVREDERIIQVDNGTIFYWQYSPPHRLFVRIHDRRIDAALPSEEIRCSGSYGNSVYFASNGKIFKANFSPSQGIIVAYFRDEIQNEVGRWGFNSIARGCEKYVTRLCDDSNNHSSFVNVTNEECKGWQVRRIHRDNVILSSRNAEAVWPSARKVRENIILVETCNQYALFVRDDSSLLYLTDGRNMFTLNTTSMKFLPTLKFRDAHISYVVGVHDGVLTCMGMKDSEYCLMAAPLPQGYYEHSTLEDSYQNDADTLTDRSRSKKQEEAELRNALKDRDEQIASLQSEITKVARMLTTKMQRKKVEVESRRTEPAKREKL